ncbi:MAG: hypothetical protein M3R24_35755 [Chloroflexota bacterium]|nr:hypothetical protein [Chloroflexota bacterium]
MSLILLRDMLGLILSDMQAVCADAPQDEHLLLHVEQIGLELPTLIQVASARVGGSPTIAVRIPTMIEAVPSRCVGRLQVTLSGDQLGGRENTP